MQGARGLALLETTCAGCRVTALEPMLGSSLSIGLESAPLQETPVDAGESHRPVSSLLVREAAEETCLRVRKEAKSASMS